MSEQQTQGDLRGRWWGVVWPRASRNCSPGSRVLSVLGAPLALLLGLLLMVGLMVALPLIAAVFMISDRLLGDPGRNTDDVATP